MKNNNFSSSLLRSREKQQQQQQKQALTPPPRAPQRGCHHRFSRSLQIFSERAGIAADVNSAEVSAETRKRIEGSEASGRAREEKRREERKVSFREFFSSIKKLTLSFFLLLSFFKRRAFPLCFSRIMMLRRAPGLCRRVTAARGEKSLESES